MLKQKILHVNDDNVVEATGDERPLVVEPTVGDDPAPFDDLLDEAYEIPCSDLLR